MIIIIFKFRFSELIKFDFIILLSFESQFVKSLLKLILLKLNLLLSHLSELCHFCLLNPGVINTLFLLNKFVKIGVLASYLSLVGKLNLFLDLIFFLALLYDGFFKLNLILLKHCLALVLLRLVLVIYCSNLFLEISPRLINHFCVLILFLNLHEPCFFTAFFGLLLVGFHLLLLLSNCLKYCVFALNLDSICVA